MDQNVKTSSSVTFASMFQSDTNNIHSVAITCEEASTLSTGFVFSYGNGNLNGYGVTQPWNGFITAMSIQQENGGVSEPQGVIEMAINGANQGSNYDIETCTSNQCGDYEIFEEPLEFSAGDIVGVECTTADSNADGIIITFWIYYR